MTFLNPLGLAGLLTLPVILALHLLHRRKTPYVVSHLGLWSFLDAQTPGPRARRVPLTMLLVLDLLIGALLSLAWARPSLAVAQPEQRPRHWVILLDVSSSMRARDAGPGSATRFEQAKSQAAGLLQAATAKDVVTILTFGQQPRVIADSRQTIAVTGGRRLADAGLSSAALLLDRVNQAAVGETGTSLPEALALGQAALDPNLPGEFHVITDGSFPLPDAQNLQQFAYPLRWHWVGQAADNRAVLDLNATALGGNRYQVFARLANYGSRAVNGRAVLTVNGRLVDQAEVEIPAGSSVPYVWQAAIPQRDQAGTLEVSFDGGDGLPEDDAAAMGLHPGGTVRVALVADDPEPIRQAVLAIPNVELKVSAPGDYAGTLARDPAPYDLTIFRAYLPVEWPAGHVLVVEPPEESSAPLPANAALLLAQTYSTIPATALTQAHETSPLVAGIDFSGVRWQRAYRLASSPPGFEALLQAGGAPLLEQGPASGAASQVTVLLADLQHGNFVKHAAYPILMANLVEQARQSPLPLAFQTGAALPLPAQGSYRTVQIAPPRGQPVRLENTWPADWSDTQEPGLYRFRLTGVDGSLSEFTAGARAGDPLESDLRQREWVQALQAAQERAASKAEQETGALDLRGWLLGAAILIILVEANLAWRR